MESESYSSVLRIPWARAVFTAALLGRFAFALIPLSAVFTFQERTGSFATAGLAIAAYGLTTVTLPAKARLVDRYGQLRILLPLAALSGVCIGSAAVLTGFSTAPALVPIALFVIGGAVVPPLGPAMRSNWRAMTLDSPARKQTAYALDSTCEEVLFLAGPLTVGILIAAVPAWVALVGAAVLLIVGTSTMVGMEPIRLRRWDVREAASREHRASAGTVMRTTGLPIVLITMFALAGGVSIVYIALAELATAQGNPSLAGYIESAMVAASVVGGLIWGKLNLASTSRTLHLGTLLSLMAAAVLSTAVLADTLWAVAAGLSIAGLALAPTFITAYLAADDVAPRARQGEAGSWVNTAYNLGAAFGAATAGVLVDARGGQSGLLLSASVLSAGVVVLLFGRRRPR
ncbi:MAG: MFS transporter [Rhodococcus sp. (in: high G+C Gram-positive bacteria)]